jgi:hypothetical protein
MWITQPSGTEVLVKAFFALLLSLDMQPPVSVIAQLDDFIQFSVACLATSSNQTNLALSGRQ